MAGFLSAARADDDERVGHRPSGRPLEALLPEAGALAAVWSQVGPGAGSTYPRPPSGPDRTTSARARPPHGRKVAPLISSLPPFKTARATFVIIQHRPVASTVMRELISVFVVGGGENRRIPSPRLPRLSAHSG